MKSSDIFDLFNSTNESYKKQKGFASAQSSYDNASPEDYGYSEPEASTEEECQAFEAYKFAMKMALDSLNKQLELYRKYGKTDVCDSIENDIQQITSDIAERESEIV